MHRMLAVAAMLLLPLSAAAAALTGKVVAVIDGDSVVVRDDRARRHEVRLAGIDAPELDQAHGLRSRAHLAQLLYGQRVTVMWYQRDRYDRLVGSVLLLLEERCGTAGCERRIDAGYAQVVAGLAWHDRRHAAEQRAEDRVRYARAEKEARSRRAGLWSERSPVPPWRHRHGYPRGLAPQSGARR
jgi:endonuclease YncB( thermonuclease family)